MLVVATLLCQLRLGDCFTISSSGTSGSGSESGDHQPFVVQATVDDLDANNVLTNEVESVQKTCDR